MGPLVSTTCAAALAPDRPPRREVGDSRFSRPGRERPTIVSGYSTPTPKPATRIHPSIDGVTTAISTITRTMRTRFSPSRATAVARNRDRAANRPRLNPMITLPAGRRAAISGNAAPGTVKSRSPTSSVTPSTSPPTAATVLQMPGAAPHTGRSSPAASTVRMIQCCTGKVIAAAEMAHSDHRMDTGAKACAPTLRVPTATNP